MKILFYRYGSICEPDLIECFEHAGIEVIQDTTQIADKNTPGSHTVMAISSKLKEDAFIFVFTINFFPAISDTCELFNVPYVCWTVDSPVMELFSESVKNKCNRIFFFDRMQYEYFGLGNGHYFYLPLATNVNRWEKAIKNATPTDIAKFGTEISMVGSLYSEKNPYAGIKGLSAKTKGYIDGIINAQLQVYGYNFIESLLTDEIMAEFVKKVPDLTLSPYANLFSPKYVMANFFIGMELAYRERIKVLNGLSEKHKVDLYTFSDTTPVPKVISHKGAKSLTEMPIIFNKSKINLNITIKPIQTGMSLRVFDVMGCCGFLMTNFQSELPEYFEIGKDLEAYSSYEELLDKCDYYLAHEEEREAIALSGYEKVKKYHTYEARFIDMIKLINQTL